MKNKQEIENELITALKAMIQVEIMASEDRECLMRACELKFKISHLLHLVTDDEQENKE